MISGTHITGESWLGSFQLIHSRLFRQQDVASSSCSRNWICIDGLRATGADISRDRGGRTGGIPFTEFDNRPENDLDRNLRSKFRRVSIWEASDRRAPGKPAAFADLSPSVEDFMSEPLHLDLTSRQCEILLRGLRFVRSSRMLEFRDSSDMTDEERKRELAEIRELQGLLDVGVTSQRTARV
ncbi:MAG: hypothetical protein C0478_11440 [Planctomyces sp.]|nr:hypothetical protein [Planctomyces sp.]